MVSVVEPRQKNVSLRQAQSDIVCKNVLSRSSNTMSMSPSELEKRFACAYDEYADALFRHCYFRTGNREVGKELMQETFMKAWEYAAKGNEVENLRAFLYRTANNLMVDFLRQKSRRTEESLEDMQETGFDIESDEDATRETEKGFADAQVVAVLQKIDEPYRSTVVMRYIDELSPQEIAQATGESVNVISVRINRGMKKLKSLLSTNG